MTVYDITTECFEWCKRQHFANDFSSLWLVYLSALCLLLNQTLLFYYYKIPEGINKDMLYKIIRILPHLALYLLIGFIIYTLYLK